MRLYRFRRHAPQAGIQYAVRFELYRIRLRLLDPRRHFHVIASEAKQSRAEFAATFVWIASSLRSSQ
jgi:hypothetical protein